MKLEDVASEAEVSIATASLALRHHTSISEETRRRVLEARDRLGYRPIRRRTPPPKVSHDLTQGSEKGFVYCIVDFPVAKLVYAGFLSGVMSACQRRGIRLELRSVTSREIAEPDRFPEEVGGVILTGLVGQTHVDCFSARGIPVVVLGNYKVEGVHEVRLDLLRTGESVAERLFRDGRQTIAHVVRDRENFFEHELLMRVRRGLEARGLSLPESRVYCAVDLVDAVTSIVARLRAAKPRIEAVFCDAVNVAEACLNEIRAKHQGGNWHPPAFYTVSAVDEEPGPLDCRLLNSGSHRMGWLAVDRLCEASARSGVDFPYASVVPPLGWRPTKIFRSGTSGKSR